MRYWALALLVNTIFFPLHAEKDVIATHLKKLETAAIDEKSEIYKDLSLSYCKDQDLERAFKTFLASLDLIKINQETLFEETANNKVALKLYLDRRADTLSYNANQIIENFTLKYAETKDDHVLGMIIALAYANLNQYEKFFTLFYQSYALAPDHFLKYKTKAILNIKLFDRARSCQEKEHYRQEIALNLKKALELYSEDSSLYQLNILFSDKLNKSFLVEALLNKIINHNIVIPRTDISFYIKQALDVGKNELAGRFIEKAAMWYPVSRTLRNERDKPQREKLKEENGN